MNKSNNELNGVVTLSEEDRTDSATKPGNIRKTETTPIIPMMANLPPNSGIISTPSSGTSSAILLGLSGFLNDYQTLSMEIKRLKDSEKIQKEKLHQKQLELNKASEEWCTAQAEQMKNEMMIRQQEAQLNSLQEEASNLRIQNNFWDSKLSLASRGLEAMFQTATNLTREDENGTINQQDLIEREPINSQLLPYTGSSTNTAVIPFTASLAIHYKKSPIISRQLKSGRLQQKIRTANRKLKILREKISKRMSEREQTHRELKSELAKRRKLLQSLEQLLWRKHRPRRVASKAGSRHVNMNVEHHLRNEQRNTITPVPSTPTSHARDSSVPVKTGFACICGEHFKFIGTLHRHLGMGKERKFTCNICNATFLLCSDLNRHLRNRHEKSFSPNTHGCRTCGAVFPNKTELMKGWKHRNGKCLKGKKNRKKTKTIASDE